jgi:aminoglycoside phosphotransferase (APT) family kinase protein
LSVGTKKQAVQALEYLPDGSMICHGDFHPDNVLMAARGPVVIDWMNTGRGNPLADVARTALTLGLGSLPPGTSLFRGWLIQSFRRIFRALYLRRYFQLWPFAQAQMKAWLLPVAAARLNEGIPGEEEQLVRLVELALKQ